MEDFERESYQIKRGYLEVCEKFDLLKSPVCKILHQNEKQDYPPPPQFRAVQRMISQQQSLQLLLYVKFLKDKVFKIEEGILYINLQIQIRLQDQDTAEI
ncbi:hypothetical protein ABPG72_019997 [Tetrahymena utriculariae]